VDRVRRELMDRIAAITDPDGRPIGSHAHPPEALYPEGAAGSPPDLTVYFGDLAWRSVGSVGLRTVHTYDNDTGPDEANHDWHGIFIANRTAAGALGRTGRQQDLHITDVAAMITRLLDADGRSPADATG
jgi:predicted AlkP superfamily phosphohydrolase/phosphomutase